MTALASLMPKTLARDLPASIVVFLVAMPLCMGIAIASGAPAEKGLVTGIIGGLVVGLLAGSPLQVSGPAAGLAVIVFELVRDQGLSALGPVLLVAGAIQFVAGVFRLGGWFRAISPAVVHGMLAGIGVLIVVGQFHVMFDAKPLPNGLANVAAIPGRLLGLDAGHPALPALMTGLVTIAVMLGWEKLRPASLRLVPGALVGVLTGTLVAFALGLKVARVAVPASIGDAFALPGVDLFTRAADPALLVSAFAIAFIASAETLLSAAAVDRMHDGPRTNYNKELRAQGVGNALCGVFGALPMTGVIVRSSANVQAGAATRLSAIMHGAWILGFVALLPWLLNEIPMAALAGILVVTGWRLISIQHVRHLFGRYGMLSAVIWAATLTMVVAEDLLTGVLVGLALSLIELVPHARRLKLTVEQHDTEEGRRIALDGAATFIMLPRLSAALDSAPVDRPVRLDMTKLAAIDHTCAEMVSEWLHRRHKSGHETELAGGDARVRRLVAA